MSARSNCVWTPSFENIIQINLEELSRSAPLGGMIGIVHVSPLLIPLGCTFSCAFSASCNAQEYKINLFNRETTNILKFKRKKVPVSLFLSYGRNWLVSIALRFELDELVAMS